MNKLSATINHDEMINDLKRYRLSESKDNQDNAICIHYIKLMNTTKILRELLEFKEQFNYKNADFKQIDEHIDYLVDKIKKEHENDFGIKLEWDIDE